MRRLIVYRLACGTEKDSVVAACVEVRIDRSKDRIDVTEVCEAFECGPILNPANLLSQVQGCIVMALGGALTEELEFEDGRILNPRFSRYRVPGFRDVSRIDVHLVENRHSACGRRGDADHRRGPGHRERRLRRQRRAPPLDPRRRRVRLRFWPASLPPASGWAWRSLAGSTARGIRTGRTAPPSGADGRR